MGQTTQKTVKVPLSVSGATADSLHCSKKIFSTSIYQGQARLRSAATLTLYQDDALAKRQYRAGRILQPIAPIVSLAGIALSYVALKGKSGTHSGYYEGQLVTADYTVRSRPKLAAGLGLFMAGIALVEFSNELVAKSARGYNLRHKGRLTSTDCPTFYFEITPSGNIGLVGLF
ncbi:hypothetical protein [Persicitalea sp.]|uniref:hypothetical protein n=1 Tax=Persicitalea sp. TaxID=3100273 RepID=UPI0035936AC2